MAWENAGWHSCKLRLNPGSEPGYTRVWGDCIRGKAACCPRTVQGGGGVLGLRVQRRGRATRGGNGVRGMGECGKAEARSWRRSALRNARGGWSPLLASARDALREQAGVGQRLALTGVHASSRCGERLRALAHRSGPAGATSCILGDKVGAGREPPPHSAQPAWSPFRRLALGRGALGKLDSACRAAGGHQLRRSNRTERTALPPALGGGDLGGKQSRRTPRARGGKGVLSLPSNRL